MIANFGQACLINCNRADEVQWTLLQHFLTPASCDLSDGAVMWEGVAARAGGEDRGCTL